MNEVDIKLKSEESSIAFNRDKAGDMIVFLHYDN